MNWFKKLLPKSIRIEGTAKRSIPEGLWDSCSQCKAVLYRPELERNQKVCMKCGFHMRIGARERLNYFFDEIGSFEIGKDVQPRDFLKFKDVKKYKDRLVAAKKKTGESDALIVFSGTVCKIPLVAAAFEFDFLGGSMGSVVGEIFVRAVRHAIENKLPFVCFCSSGGARMQEGLISLMQMAKTSSALGELRENALPYITVLADPTTGGVSASLGTLGDVIIAEPKALIGFAGPRVIEQTVGQILPEGFQRSEFLLKHGAIDMIVERKDLREKIAKINALFTNQMGVFEADAEGSETK